MKKNVYFFLTLVLISVLVSGCMKRESPEITIKNFCNAILKHDKESLSKFGTNADADGFRNKMINGLAQSFQSTVGNGITNDQSRRIAEAVVDSLRKSNVSTKLISEDKDSAVVEVTVSCLDIGGAIDRTVNEVDRTMSPFAGNAEIIEAFTQTLVREVGNLQSSGSRSFTVNCIWDRDKKVWKPEDESSFNTQLGTSIMGQ